MKYSYTLTNGALTPCDAADAPIVVYEKIIEADKEEICRLYDLDPLDIEGILDPDEVSRVDFAPDRTFLIWKIPDNATVQNTIQFNVSSLGVILTPAKLVFVTPVEGFQIGSREVRKAISHRDCFLRILLASVRHYQGHLKAIKQVSQEIESKLVTSMENRYLLQMFALGESLVYYLNAIETNQTVLTKIRATPDKIGFTSDELELLDDVIIENQQAGKQAGIYTSVLSGLMDARGTVINNNMNVLLKNLTIINVVFLPLNLIASIFGMSEYSMITSRFHWTVSYSAFLVISIAIGWATWWWLTHVMERQHMTNGIIK